MKCELKCLHFFICSDGERSREDKVMKKYTLTKTERKIIQKYSDEYQQMPDEKKNNIEPVLRSLFANNNCNKPMFKRNSEEYMRKFFSPELQYVAWKSGLKVTQIQLDEAKSLSETEKEFEQTIPDEMLISNYQDVANAIVARAAEDYREVMYKLQNPKLTEFARETLVAEREELLEFFNEENDWYITLTNVDPNYIIERIDMEFE